MHKKLKQGAAYAIHHGDFAGQIFIYINENKQEQSYNFLSLPDMYSMSVSYIDFQAGIKNELVKFVENVPRHVCKVIVKQYKKNATSNN